MNAFATSFRGYYFTLLLLVLHTKILIHVLQVAYRSKYDFFRYRE